MSISHGGLFLSLSLFLPLSLSHLSQDQGSSYFLLLVLLRKMGILSADVSSSLSSTHHALTQTQTRLGSARLERYLLLLLLLWRIFLVTFFSPFSSSSSSCNNTIQCAHSHPPSRITTTTTTTTTSLFPFSLIFFFTVRCRQIFNDHCWWLSPDGVHIFK